MSRLGQLGPAVRLMIVLTVVLGLAYPLAVTGVGQVLLGSQADGSLVHERGHVVGSSLIGQSYAGDPAYFQSRPSVAGDQGYDPLATGASNLSLDSPALLAAIERRREVAVASDGPADPAPDALLASGSGLDPHISPAYAAQQVSRVARERRLPTGVVRRLVARNTKGRTLGFLGEPRVNVLLLNLALDRASD